MGSKTIHNFRAEDKTIYVLGGFVILRKPRAYFVCNVIFLVIMLLLYVFLTAMGIATVIIFSKDSEVVEQALQVMLMQTTGGFLTPLIGLRTASSLDLAADILLKGINQYLDEDSEHDNIKQNRVKQINFICDLFKKVFILHPILIVFIAPLIKMLILSEEQKNAAPLNPLLPFPIYMPFDTRTLFGYGVASITSAVSLFFLVICGMCLVMTYLSCSFQLIAQIEILNYSLKNIETRAFSKLIKSGTIITKKDKENLYQLMEYQEWLYFCLRENILHHQNILRFLGAVRPYLEAVYALSFFSIGLLLAAAIILLLEKPSVDPAVVVALALTFSASYLFSYGSQCITDKSAETVQLLYSTPWPHCDASFKVLLKIMISKSQKLIILRAAGLNMPGSLETFADMISGAYKMINLFRP